MSKNSQIEWTDHTFNPWWGCVEVSPACARCYARDLAKFRGHRVWGGNAPRRLLGDNTWKQPLRWNAEAVRAGRRRRVFCASMADVFEARADLEPHRQRLWKLIEETPMLDWLLLTKRPQNIELLAPWRETWPENVWLGTTVEDQKHAELRLPHLLKHPVRVRFLSCEPLLEPIDLRVWLDPNVSGLHPVDWIIAGGESGRGARPMHIGWARSLRDQAVAAGVAFHFKQWGVWAPGECAVGNTKRKVADIGGIPMVRMSKKSAGRMLDGRTWDEYPDSSELT